MHTLLQTNGWDDEILGCNMILAVLVQWCAINLSPGYFSLFGQHKPWAREQENERHRITGIASICAQKYRKRTDRNACTESKSGLLSSPNIRIISSCAPIGAKFCVLNILIHFGSKELT